MDLTLLTDWLWILGLLGLGVTWMIWERVRKLPPGNEVMRGLAAQVQSGAMAFARRVAVVMGAFVVLAGALLFLVAGYRTAGAFAGGAVCAMAAAFSGLFAAVRVNVRTAEAARYPGLPAALRTGFEGGAVAGLAVASLAVLGTGLLYLMGIGRPDVYEEIRFREFAEIVSGFAMGASSIALFARVGGGIFTKAADMGADLVGKLEAGIPEDDPRNPATIADLAGDCAGGTAGMGADLFESCAAAVIAAIAVGMTEGTLTGYENRIAAVALPLFAIAAGLIASIAGVFLLRHLKPERPAAALRTVQLASAALFLVMAFGIVFALGFDLADESTGRVYHYLGPFLAILAGTVAGTLVGAVTAFFTGPRAARGIAEASSQGAAANVLAGISAGLQSSVPVLLIVCAAVGAAYASAGLYGIAMAAVGMLATVGITMTVHAFGPIADNAGGIVQLGHLGPDARRVTEGLHTAGKESGAVITSFSIAAAALTSIALYAAYASWVGLAGINLIDPVVVIGFLLGGAVPFAVAALTITSVSKAARAVIAEVRRQFSGNPGIMEGTVPPDSAACVDVATRHALREMIIPGVLTVVAPVLVGAGLGVEALGGMLAGATVTGVLLATFMANAGSAWDLARQHVDMGAAGGRGSPAHQAALVGDTIGDPFKDTAGPSMNILIKLMSLVSLALVPWLLSLPINQGKGAPPQEPALSMLEAIARAVTHLV
ncbi:sodium-translocating pyrophosphatase [Longimicrobium sp.]|uniref:sodium-translocating pyrophosphatase n=1 Tax=Longimicrobium sp. TaxID=2029185 RepID=UPI002E30D7DB|nr:sodium-translocating pyrophosphatase [Longimicrobium sp.]HEX6041659.1 sodium-translocating pyrophosphatase [Longimicrobium sp.]